MAIEPNAGRSLLYDALAQNDVDMQFHKLLNLDTSNLPPIGAVAPPTEVPAPNFWIKEWHLDTLTWVSAQVNFTNLAGNLTAGQQGAITALGTITSGQWQAAIIDGAYLDTLDKIRSPVASVNLANHTLINVGDPVNAQDAVNKRFMDLLLQGLQPKQVVRLATTTNVPRIGLLTIDGQTLHAQDRVLVKNQSVGREDENGIYIATATGLWPRDPDADSATELKGAYCVVSEGTLNANTSWVQVNTLTDPIGPGDIINFVEFSTAVGAPGPQGPPGPGVALGGTTTQVLAKKSNSDYDTQWVDADTGTAPVHALVQSAQLQPAGTLAVAPGVMMGLNQRITLVTSGKVVATITGWVWNDNNNGNVAVMMRAGLAPVPGNGGNPAGIQLGSAVVRSAIGANKGMPFSVTGILSGLSTGIEIWFDLLIYGAGGGKSTVTNVCATIYEIP